MPASCGYAWSDALDAIIVEEAAGAGVPIDLAYTFIAVESGFDPAARNDNPPLEDSVGLLQLNRLGGQGAGYSVEQLSDPRFNLRVGLPPIASAYAGAWRADVPPYEFIYGIAVQSGHPGLVDRSDPRIVRIFQVWACFVSGVGQFGPGGAPGATVVAGPGQGLAQFIAGHTTLFMFPGGIIRHLLSQLVWNLSPQGMAKRVIFPLTPRGFVSRFSAAYDPRRLDPTRRLRAVLDHRVRLPPGHHRRGR